jgi:hypothetical protein
MPAATVKADPQPDGLDNIHMLQDIDELSSDDDWV